MLSFLRFVFVALLFTALGLGLARTDWGQLAAQKVDGGVAAARSLAASQVAGRDTRMRVLIENPELIKRISEGGSFGGDNHSTTAAQNMFGKDHDEAIADVRKKTRAVEVAPRTWLIRMPIVNAVLFETDAGMVLVDTGMAPAGPAIVDAIKSVSDKPLHTVIITHGHVDHAYGTWALLDTGWTPEIIAHENIIPRFQRYIDLRGSLARYMSQQLEQLPHSTSDIVWPTKTFGGSELTLSIGGEDFVLKHYPAETDDQLFVWVPGRKAIVAADYYQGFLPNAGNGKRVQRYVKEWVDALREMVALEPQLLLPTHGEQIVDPEVIAENLTVLADALEHIRNYTLLELNKGTRKDVIFENASLPPELAKHPTLNVQYVSVKDISKMVLKRYTGWWDDIPSNWSPAPMQKQGQAIVEMAGGVPQLVKFTRELAENDLQLASHFADWGFYAHPDNAAIQDLVIDIYRQRIMDPESNTQEMLTYLDQIVLARQYQLGLVN